jgi:hypothetical protein
VNQSYQFYKVRIALMLKVDKETITNKKKTADKYPCENMCKNPQ